MYESTRINKPRVEKKCEGCETILSLPPSESARRYCSNGCRKGHKIRHNCIKCGDEIVSYLCYSRHLKKYCSYTCYRTANGWQDQPKKKHPDSRPCSICGVTIQRPRRSTSHWWSRKLTCSNECAAAWRKIRPVAVKCNHCGKEDTVKGQKPKRYYCAYACMANAGKVELGARGIEPAWRDEYGTKCVICSYDRVVEYAHLIPYRKGGTIHPDNIVPMCPNHHTLFDKGLLAAEEKAILRPLIGKADASSYSRLLPIEMSISRSEPTSIAIN